MKKLFIVLSVSLASLFANASYLYWQVDSSDYEGIVGADQVTGARLVSDPSGVISYYPSYNDTTGEASSVQLSDSGALGVMYAADISNHDSGYSYYIELVNSNKEVIGKSITPLTSSSPNYASYVNNGTTTANLTNIPTVNLNAWHGGSFRAVPEPTSAILMLFGAAMLGLKRKNRSLN